MPKVSVIVPVYNVEKYLDRCVKSIQNQTLRDLEIILVDDGSPDNCPAMCDEYARQDPRIKVIHKKNEGLGFARNTGMELALGEYITFCDSDDWVDPSAYQDVYGICKQNRLDMCSFQFRRVKADGKTIELPIVKAKEFCGKTDISKFVLGLLGRNPEDEQSEVYGMSSCMALFRKDLMLNSGVKYPSEKVVASEDLLFLLNFALHLNKIAIIPNVYYNYYINPASISQNYDDAKHARLIKMLEEIRLFCGKHFEYREYKNHYYSQILRIFKLIIRFTAHSNYSLTKRIAKISEETKNPILDGLYNDSVRFKYPLIDRFFVFSMKHHLSLLLILLYKFKK